jgi:pimeloyl-ACP methyl ester carboxylesterase
MAMARYKNPTRRGVVAGLGLIAGASLLPYGNAFGVTQMRLVPIRDGKIEYFVDGEGPIVAMIPSFGRGAEDFEILAAALVRAGYRVVRPQPRGIGGSTGPMEGVSIHDLADDVAAVIRDVGGPAVVLGHAYGQRVARVLAADHPDLVRALIMLAAGGKIPSAPEIGKSVRACFDESLSADEHMAAVKIFFAPGNDPTPWRGGWYGSAVKVEGPVMRETAADSGWWSAGGKVPILLIQGLQDLNAPVENARLLKREFPDRVQLVELDHTAHAMLPEQPDRIAALVLNYLRNH